MKKENLIFVLEKALPYVRGAYDSCVFPDELENEYLDDEITKAINELKEEGNEIDDIKEQLTLANKTIEGLKEQIEDLNTDIRSYQ